ncbi:MAG TPA: cytochrome P450 [Acidimicrobiales bacterium]|jgi:cytochrome P450|nr:cytochrome P450 [Acidimicrobiales bacterium]
MATARTDRLFEPEVVEQPHTYYAHLRQFDPVHPIDGTNAFLVARLDLIREVIANPQIYSSQSSEFLCLGEANQPYLRSPASVPSGLEGMDAVLATADPPDHGRQRKVLSHLFSAAAIGAREEEFRRLVDSTLDPYLRDGQVDWMRSIAEPLPVVMLTRLLGLSDDTAPALKDQGYASVELIGGFVPETAREELLRKMTELGPAIDAYVGARSSDHPDQTTVIGACAQAVTDGRLSEVEVFVILGILLAAGGESTTSLLGTGARILAEQPDLQDRLRAQPDLISAFVEEACRIDPPFRGHYRRVVADTVLGGIQLETGSRLILLWPAANRDPEAFADPENIDVHRTNPRQHVGFGWGIHLCLGAPLARMEAKVTFERLLARTSSFSIDVASESLHHHKSLMVRRLVALPLTLRP